MDTVSLLVLDVSPTSIIRSMVDSVANHNNEHQNQYNRSFLRFSNRPVRTDGGLTSGSLEVSCELTG